MRAAKYILTFLFIVTLTASAFGAWTTQETTPYSLTAIDGLVSTDLVTLCAVGGDGSVEVSTDYGNTWSFTTSPNSVTPAESNFLRCVDLVGNLIYVGGYIGPGDGNVLWSADQGTTWTNTASSPGMVYVEDIDFWSNTSGVIVGYTSASGPQIRRTTNTGGTWTSPTTQPGTTPSDKYLGLHALSASQIFVVGTASSTTAAVVLSTDGGDNWVSRGYGINATDKLNDVFFVDANTGYIAGQRTAIGIVYKTTDGGLNWSLTGTLGAATELKDLYFIDANNGWAVGYTGVSVGAIYSTTDGGTTWVEELGNSSLLTQMNGVYFTDSKNGWAIGSNAADTSGRIIANFVTFEITSVTQESRPTQSQAPRGFTGNTTIIGNNFQAGSWTTANVDFVGTGITVNSVTRNSATQLTANLSIAADAQLGDEDVDVTNIDGTMATGNFTITDLPVISALSTYEGTQDDSNIALTLQGNYFQDGCSVLYIYQTSGDTTGVQVGPVTFNSSTNLSTTITISATASTGAWDVIVTNPDGGTSEAKLFNVKSSSPVNPTITSVNPNEVNRGQTTTLTVRGSNFDSDAAVTFSDDGITVNSTTFKTAASVEANITVNAIAHYGPRSLIVTNASSGGSGILVDAITVISTTAVTPAITTVDTAPFYQGTTREVIINGINFMDGAVVVYDSTDGLTQIDSPGVQFVSSTQLRVTTQIDSNAPTTARAIEVRNPDGGNTKTLGAFLISAQAASGSSKVVGPICAYPNPNNFSKIPTIIQVRLDGPAQLKTNAYDITGRSIVKNAKITQGVAGYNKITFQPTDFIPHAYGSGILKFLVVIDGKETHGVKVMHLGWR
jgi:photosystem II stability/assembly factor-like uncharacterized protein